MSVHPRRLKPALYERRAGAFLSAVAFDEVGSPRDGTSTPALKTDSWAHPDLLVPETICGPIEPPYIKCSRLVTADTAVQHDAVTWLECLVVHPDRDEFPPIVQFASPAGGVTPVL